MSDNRPIGVFDSGIGGLTVLREIWNELPRENTIYFGDNGRTPYGTKSHDTIIKYSLQNMRFLESMDVKMIVIACGTASAHAYQELKKHSKVPVFEVVRPAAYMADKLTNNGKIGVIATRASVNSGIYEDTLETARNELLQNHTNTEALKKLKIIQKACPLFVPLAEEGWWDNEITERICEEYLKEVKDFGVDTLILGCTHYPLLSKIIGKYMGDKVKLVNAGKAVASVLKAKMNEMGIEADNNSKADKLFYTSDDALMFEEIAGNFLGGGRPSGTKSISTDIYDVSDIMISAD